MLSLCVFLPDYTLPLFLYIFYLPVDWFQTIGNKKFVCFTECLHPKIPCKQTEDLDEVPPESDASDYFSMDFFICAGRPQSRNTIGRSCSFRTWIAASVNCSQPIPLCEFA